MTTPKQQASLIAPEQFGFKIWEMPVETGDPMGVFMHDSQLEFRVAEDMYPGDVIHCFEQSTAEGQREPREKDFVIEGLSPVADSNLCVARVVSGEQFNSAVSVALKRYEDLLGKAGTQPMGPTALDGLFNCAIALRNRKTPQEQEEWVINSGMGLWLAQVIGLLSRLNQVHCGYHYERDLSGTTPRSQSGQVRLQRSNRKWLRTHDEIAREEVTGAGAMALGAARVARLLNERSHSEIFKQEPALILFLLSAYDYLHELHLIGAVSRHGACGPKSYMADPEHAAVVKLRSLSR